MSGKIESVIKNHPITKKRPGANGFTGEFHQTSEEELKPIFLNPSKK